MVLRSRAAAVRGLRAENLPARRTDYAVSKKSATPADLVTEAEWQRTVEELLDANRWRWTHFRPARTAKGWRTALSGHKGMADIIATRGGHPSGSGGRLLFLELKSERGVVEDEQHAWLDALDAVGCDRIECYVLYPSGKDRAAQILA